MVDIGRVDAAICIDDVGGVPSRAYVKGFQNNNLKTFLYNRLLVSVCQDRSIATGEGAGGKRPATVRGARDVKRTVARGGCARSLDPRRGSRLY